MQHGDAIDQMLTSIYRRLVGDGWGNEVFNLGRDNRRRAGKLAQYRLFMLTHGYPIEDVNRTNIPIQTGNPGRRRRIRI